MDTVTANSNNITATKRKGGRTSRWAMKKNRSNTKQEATERTNQNSVAAVPVPPTPALENEGLSITTSDGIDFEDFMVLEGDNTEDKVERSEEEEEQVGASNNGESGDDSLRPGGDKEITETTQEGGHHLQLQGIDGGGELCLINGMVDTWLLENEGGVVTSLTEERERNDEVSCFDYKKATGDQPECTNSSNTQDYWYSGSPMPPLFEYDYWHNWEIGVDDQLMNHNDDQPQKWDVDKQNLLSWLWEDDDCQITQQTDPEKQNPEMPLILS